MSANFSAVGRASVSWEHDIPGWYVLNPETLIAVAGPFPTEQEAETTRDGIERPENGPPAGLVVRGAIPRGGTVVSEQERSHIIESGEYEGPPPASHPVEGEERYDAIWIMRRRDWPHDPGHVLAESGPQMAKDHGDDPDLRIEQYVPLAEAERHKAETERLREALEAIRVENIEGNGGRHSMDRITELVDAALSGSQDASTCDEGCPLHASPDTPGSEEPST